MTTALRKRRMCTVLVIVVVVMLLLMALRTKKGGAVKCSEMPDRNQELDSSKEKLIDRNQEIDSSKKKLIDRIQKLDSLKEKLIEVSKSLQKAKIHVRGIKTARHINSAISSMTSALQLLQINPQNLTVRSVKQPVSVCPDEFKGSKHGYPRYHTGFVTTNCTYGKPMETLLTVLLYFDKISREERMSYINKTVRTLSKYHDKVSINIGTNDTSLFPPSLKQFTNIHVEELPKESSLGKVWNKLLESVYTEYVFFARDLEVFTEDARLDRLIRAIERLDVDVAAGASKDTGGHWRIGCHQRALRNSTLVYKEGYDESLLECLFCDHVDGPFIMKTTTAKKIKYDGTIKESGVFEDFFIRMSYQGFEAIVCPDVMFHVVKVYQSNQASAWSTFAAKRQLTSLKLSSGHNLEFTCPAKINCFPGSGMAVATCCLQELSKAVKFTMKACADANIHCEICDGTMVGVAKFSAILPWERDADLIYPKDENKNFTKIINKFKDAGYGFIIDSGRPTNMKAASKHWHVDLWGMQELDSRVLLSEGLVPTKVLLDGAWVIGPTNPGSFVRNLYGREVYKHAEHWGALGLATSFVEYSAGKFISCGSPLHPFCLDNYNADGSLQFIQDPIP